MTSPDAPAPLYSARQIALATVVGTALGGLLLLAANARAMGARGLARLAVVLGVGAALGCTLLHAPLHRDWLAVALLWATPSAVVLIVAALHGASVRRRRAAGTPGRPTFDMAVSVGVALVILACGFSASRWLTSLPYIAPVR